MDTPSAPQFAILDYLLPGFSSIISAANAFLGIDIGRYLPAIVVVLGGIIAWGHVRDSLWALVEDHLMSSVRIRTDDEIYNYVMLWLSKQRFATSSRHFLANTDINSRSSYMYRYGDSDDERDSDDDDDDDDKAKDVRGGCKALRYTPAFGTHWFWYGRQPLVFERHQNRERMSFETASEREELSLSCFGRSPRVLKELLLEARAMHLRRDKRKTLIYRGNLLTVSWQRCMARLNRPLQTVILSERVRQDMIDDAADYLDPATRRWYANRGIPYRRGYLLYGPPGTGKSSLSLALAGYFGIKIYMVSLSSTSATEENITTLFNDLPTRCIVLLEDIDTAGLAHTRDDAQPSSDPAPGPPPASTPTGGRPAASPPTTVGGRLSLSGLLNILDGVASQEGRILIMTTNHVDKLDKALIRPGRVDMTIPFSLADRDMMSSIFRAIYAPYDNETSLVGRRRCSTDTHDTEEAKLRYENNQRERERVREMAEKFANKMPELEFSPAEIQGLLLRHKRSPQVAMAAVEDWVVRTRREKRERAEKEAAAQQTERKRQGAEKPRAGDDARDEEMKARTQTTEAKSDKETSTRGTGPLTGAKNASDSGYETP
ncbi:putative BCS1 protein precursor [Ophiocordyceps camponoti-floridani]|uniref:Putative BCS1 protein n=1 Tax=Ophiocordyceps camponoti-floridani TaxID=2030778 RepID=A0A8H4QDZ6_9HYPO|nr:putative BCS1 protein precursor [Ophiocordyceps camponoti-floridani]